MGTPQKTPPGVRWGLTVGLRSPIRPGSGRGDKRGRGGAGLLNWGLGGGCRRAGGRPIRGFPHHRSGENIFFHFERPPWGVFGEGGGKPRGGGFGFPAGAHWGRSYFFFRQRGPKGNFDTGKEEESEHTPEISTRGAKTFVVSTGGQKFFKV